MEEDKVPLINPGDANNIENQRKPDFSKQIDIESLISAPLVAVSKANVVMVKGQTRFILDYCFSKKDNEPYKPVMIEMVLTKGFIEEEKNKDDNSTTKVIRTVNLHFSVPLLILVPLNSLAINKVSLEYDLEITDANSWECDIETEPGEKNVTRRGTQLYGKISYDNNQNGIESRKNQYQSSMNSKIKVIMDAGPLPLPVGVLSILDLYNRSIQSLPVNNNN
jgi:hypothetical protein